MHLRKNFFVIILISILFLQGCESSRSYTDSGAPVQSSSSSATWAWAAIAVVAIALLAAPKPCQPSRVLPTTSGGLALDFGTC